MKMKFTLLVPALVASTFLFAQEAKNSSKADRWIQDNSKSLRILPQSKMVMSNVRQGNAGETLRYAQTLNGVPVYKSELVLHYNKHNDISYSGSEGLKEIKNIDTNPKISKEEAFDKAYEASKSAGKVTYQENILYVYLTEEGDTKLVYRVLIKSHDNPGSWETIVDAKSGEIISVKNVANYHHRKGEKFVKEDPPKKVSGTGYVFDPDPLSATGSTYGGQYVDNNDATNASLDAARKLVTLPEIELAGGIYKLKGKYAEIASLETPNTGLFTQSTPDFLFNRNQQGFEAVNIYWHVTNSLTYINEVLGINCVSLWNNGVVEFDPHGEDGDDNSHYDVGQLVFGEGCVDDAEDADVILHELGHGIHDWLTNGSLSQVQGLSEGSGDYWAQSYSRSLNQWPSSSPQYNWMFSWDGHNTCWAGRITNYTALYPGTGTIHIRGQIWASSLMRIFDKIGKEKTDRAFLEGLSRTSSSTNQQQAATAVRQAALDMVGTHGFTCADIATMTTEFTASGYTLPSYTCNLAAADIKVEDIKIFPNPTTDFININLKDKKDAKVEIYGLDGKLIRKAVLSKDQSKVDVRDLIKGIYILKVVGTDLSQKFIKQ